jgi:signal transduction histidine kinase/CheY-like chemotaxis protein/HPt (histidine-containing phosphotransfer) domain-containing protein
MNRSKLRYFLLGLFLLGVVFIVIIQYNSSRNIDELIGNNNEAVEELKLQQKVEGFISAILGLENRTKTIIMANDQQSSNSLKPHLAAIKADLERFQLKSENTALNSKFQEFKRIAKDRIVLSEKLISTYQLNGKLAAEQLISANKELLLERSLVNLGQELNEIRHQDLKNVIQDARKSGDTAKVFGYVLAVFALISSILAFWYISNKLAEQEKIIEALNASERKIKEASRLKEQFMANISHEIRTPMNAILGFTNLLKRTKLNTDQGQFVENIHSAGENLLALVNDILDLSKIEAGMMGLEKTRFSVRSLVSSIRAMFLGKVKKKGLQLQVDINENVPDILSGDSVRLTQILVNLIGNAVKFTEKGSIRLGFELLQQTGDKVRLLIIVEDTGIGIHEAKQKMIFERFHQAELDTTRRFGGTGLGLAIVKQLVEMQGGTINLRSTPGIGSIFSIVLEYTIPADTEEEVGTIINEATFDAGNKVKVLIAEDNTMNQQLIRHLMQNWQINFTIVNNGQEAVDKLKEDDFSLVLMDIQMPQMDGYTATEQIRNQLRSKIPIIAMTAHAMAGEKEKCLEIGMNDYVSKPLNENTLFNMIAQYAHFQDGEHNNDENNTHKDDVMQNHQEAELKYVDLVYLHELSGNDKEFEKMMLQQITIQAPAEVDQLEQAIQTGDFLSVKKIAHSLKSTVGYVGLADELHPNLERIEKSALAANLEEIVNNFVRVKQVTDEAVKEVHTLLNNMYGS